MEFRQQWPLNNDSIIQVRGLFRIVLPDDKHPKAVVETVDDQQIFLHFDKFTMLVNVERELKEINEWRRRRGGKQPVENKPNPREYLKHDDEVQHPSAN